MKNSKAFLHYQLITSILQGGWMIDRDFAESQLPVVVQLLEGKLPWAVDWQTKQDVAGSDANGDYIFGPVKVMDNVRVMEISGPMTKHGGICSYGTLDYIEMMQDFYEDDASEAGIIIADTPGGEVGSIAELHDWVKNDTKPVVVWVRDMMASAGVWSLGGAQYVMASQEQTAVGSIGVYTRWVDWSAYMEKAGVKVNEVYSRLSSEKNIESREAAKGNVKPLTDRLDELAQAFIDTVKADRGSKLNLEAGDPFKGRTFTAKDALAIGLIDEIGSFDVAFERAQDLARERRAGQKSVYSIQPTNKSEMFGDKHPKITALRGVDASAVTEEQINAINASLAEQGISGVQVVNAQWQADAQQLQQQAQASAADVIRLNAQVEQLQGQVSTLTTERDTVQGQVTTLTQERDAARQQAAAYGKQPGATPAVVVKQGEEANEDPKSQSPENNPLYQAVDDEVKEARAKAGIA